MTKQESRRCADHHFKERIGRGDFHSEEWPWYEMLDEETRDWARLVPQLYEEYQEGDGRLMRSIAERFIGVAPVLIQSIDEIDDREA